uniref:SAM domain-containing protein n=1 Tax=Plectus sambesii TaxID=2011161 RepID=A0A914USJ6_9BILA
MSSSAMPSVKVNLGPSTGLGAQVTVTKRQTSLSPVFDKAPTLSPVNDSGVTKMVISRSTDQNSSLPVVRVKTAPRIVSTTLGISQIRNAMSRSSGGASAIANADASIAVVRSTNNSGDYESGRMVECATNKDDGCDTESSGSPDDLLDGGKKSNRKQTFPPKSPTSTTTATIPLMPAAGGRRGQTRIIRLDCARGVLDEDSTESKLGSGADVTSPPTLSNNDAEGRIVSKRDASGGTMIRRIVITRPMPPPQLDDQTQHRVMHQIPSPPPAPENGPNKPVKIIVDLSKSASWSGADESGEGVGKRPAGGGDDDDDAEALPKKRPYKRRFPSLSPAQNGLSEAAKTEVKRRRRRTKVEMEEARRAILANGFMKKRVGRPPMERSVDRTADRTVDRTSLQRTFVRNAVIHPDESCEMLKDCAMRTGSRPVPCWHQLINSKISKANALPRSAHEVAQWSIEKVAEFVNSLSYMRRLDDQLVGDRFADQLIDGEALLLLSQDDFVSKLNVKLGPAVKLHNMLLYLKHLAEQ